MIVEHSPGFIVVFALGDMRSFLLVFISIFGPSEASIQCGSGTTFFQASKYTWLEVLVTIAKTKTSPNTSFGTITAALSDGISNAVGNGVGQLSLATIPSNLWNGQSTSFSGSLTPGCGGCLLSFINDIVGLISSKSLSSSCLLSTHYTSQTCIASMSPALVAFSICNDPTNRSGDLIANLGAPRCAHLELVSLDTQLGLYRNLVSMALYSRYYDVPAFENGKANMRCNTCFNNFVTLISVYGRAAMTTSTACGDQFGSDNIFTAACYSTAYGSNAGQLSNSISTALSALETCLGGGFKVALHDPAKHQSVCSTYERTVLESYRLYDSLLQCTLAANGQGPFDSTTLTYSSTWTNCIRNSRWKSASPLILPTSSSCWGCFGEYVARIYAEETSGNSPSLSSLCRGAGKGSLDTLCINAIEGRDLNNFLRQCTGLIFPTTSPMCTLSDIESFSSITKSAIPLIKTAKIALADPTMPTLIEKESRAFSILQGYLDISVARFSGLPCESCYRALLADIIDDFQQHSASLNACANEFSSACYDDANTWLSLASFMACSGFTLISDTSPYKCSGDSDAAVIRQFQLGPIIYEQVIGEHITSSASGILQVQSILNEIEMASRALPCGTCFEDAILSMFSLSAPTLSTCRTTDRATCIAQPQFVSLLNKFSQCAGIAYSFEAIVANTTDNSTPSISIPTLTYTDTTLTNYSTTKSAIRAHVLPVLGLAVSLLGFM